MSVRDPTIAQRSKRYRENRKRRSAATPPGRGTPTLNRSAATSTGEPAQKSGETAGAGQLGRAKRARVVARPRSASGATARDARGATVAAATVEMMAPSAQISQRASWTPGAAILTLIALLIGTLALAINAQTGWRFGTTPAAALTFACLSVAVDGLALALPGAAVALWQAGNRVLSIAAWIVASAAVVGASLASLGFAQLHFGDTAAGRVAMVASTNAIADRRAAGINTAERAANAAARAREAECVVRGSRCRDRETDERSALTALASAIAAPVPAAATIAADPDPQVSAAMKLAKWLGLEVTAEGVGNLRLALLALLPNVSGLVLAFAIALRRSNLRQT
jgi:hypothetical protein